MPDINSQDPTDGPLSDDSLDTIAGGNFDVSGGTRPQISGGGTTKSTQTPTSSTAPTAPTTTTTSTTPKSASFEPNKITFT